MLVILATIALISMAMPTSQAYDGTTEDENKYYWIEGSSTTVQIKDDDSIYSVENSDAVVDGYSPHHDWGEIRLSGQDIYGEPTYNGDRGTAGKARLTVRPYKPVESSTADKIEMQMDVIVTIEKPDYMSTDYVPDGLETLYFNSHGDSLTQNNDFSYDIGGTNIEPTADNSAAADFYKSAHNYMLGQMGVPTDEIDLAREAISAWTSSSDEPSFKEPVDHNAMRELVMYDKNDGYNSDYDGRYMSFFESIKFEMDENEPDSQIEIYADARPEDCTNNMAAWDNDGYIRPEVGDKVAKWVIDIEQLSDIQDGGGGGGGCPYVSPYNGTKYKRDNNILVQSEFKEGEVTDYYKLDNDLAEQNGEYSLKVEEFENSEDYLDQMKLYTIDHKEGYKVGVTPSGEYLTYKDSDPPTSARTSDGDDVLKKVNEKNDGKRLEMEAGSEITLNYGDESFSDWKHSKLVLRSSGFSSYTDESDGFSTNAVKTSLYVKLRSDNSDWYNVTCTHPRNNPHDHVIPLEETIHKMLKDGYTLDDMEVKIRSTKKHNIDYVGLDDSAPTPVKVQEADLLEVMKTDLKGKTIEKTGSLEHDDSDVVNLVPGEECTITFEVTDKFPGQDFEERDFIIETTGWYEEHH